MQIGQVYTKETLPRRQTAHCGTCPTESSFRQTTVRIRKPNALPEAILVEISSIDPSCVYRLTMGISAAETRPESPWLHLD